MHCASVFEFEVVGPTRDLVNNIQIRGNSITNMTHTVIFCDWVVIPLKDSDFFLLVPFEIV